MTEEELQKEVSKASTMSASVAQKHAGLMNIYTAACIIGNKKDMDNVRGQLHNCLDELLDSNARVFMLTRKLTGLDN